MSVLQSIQMPVQVLLQRRLALPWLLLRVLPIVVCRLLHLKIPAQVKLLLAMREQTSIIAYLHQVWIELFVVRN